MAKLMLKLVLPTTIIAFLLFTKWWYVDVVDGPHTLLYGFPIPFMENGPTSLSTVFFIAAFFFNFGVYFIGFLILIFLVNKFVFNIKINKILLIILWLAALIIMIFTFMLWSDNDNLYYWKMPESYNYTVIQTEFNYVGNDQRRKYFDNFEQHANYEK